jgi:hypothetical protein
MSSSVANAPQTGARVVADKVYLWGMLLFLVAGVVQFFLAGLGVFDINGRRLSDATSLDPHRALGFAMGILAIVLLVVALVARANGRTMLVTLVLAILTAVGQSALAAAGENTAVFGGLHALDGLLILGLAGYLHGQARRRQPR